MASHYAVAPRQTTILERYSGVAAAVSKVGKHEIPVKILQRALSCLIASERSALQFVSKAWYHAVNERIYQKEEDIKGKQDAYHVLRQISRRDAKAIFEQTGIVIGFVPGQARIQNFVLGKGAFGEFCLGISLSTKKLVGIKITRGNNACEREAKIQQALTGLPSIMPMLDYVRSENALYQVMEPAGLGSAAKLKKHLDKLSDFRFKEQVLFILLEGLSRGLEGMHAKGVYHLDIKPDNVVVNRDGIVFIIDFGCSKHSSQAVFNVRVEDGDVYFFSPERVLAMREDAPSNCDGIKVDAWAVGLTLLVLSGVSFNEELFKNLSDKVLKAKTLAEARHKAFEYVQNQLRVLPDNPLFSLIKELLHPDPVKRLSPTQARRHKWFQQMQEGFTEWGKYATAYLREFVQSMHRGEELSILSPQTLPLPHFAAFVERVHLQDKLQGILLGVKDYSKTTVTVCHGIGGVGKTQLITRLVHQRFMQTHFGLRLWFRNSNDRASLETQIFTLALELGIISNNTSLEQAVKELHGYLAKQEKPWVMVFDNAENEKLFQSFCPPCGGHVIVTTRSVEWVGAITVDVLTPSEAEALVFKLLQETGGALCQELGYLPLGIGQACAFIRNQNITIQEYLERLRTDAAVIELDENLFGKKLPKSLLALWQASFQAIQRSCPEAFGLLNVLAYFAPENIPGFLMDRLAPPEFQAVLKKYALLQESSDRFFSVHRLVQLAARQGQSLERQQKAIMHGMQKMYSFYSEDKETPLLHQQNVALLPHGEHILPYARTMLPTAEEPVILFVQTLHWVGVAHQFLAQPYKQKAYLNEAWHVLKQIPSGAAYVQSIRVLRSLGILFRTLGEYETAKQCHIEANRVHHCIYGEDNPGILDCLANACAALNELDQAIELHQKALQLYKGKCELPISIASCLSNLGETYRNQGNIDKAVACYEEALKIMTTQKIERNDVLGTIYNNLGLAYVELHDRDRAKECYKKAIAIQKEIYGEGHPQVIVSINNLLGILDDAEAVDQYRQLLKTLREIYGRYHLQIAIILNNLGKTLLNLNQRQEALQCLQEALDVSEKIKDSFQIAFCCSSLGSFWEDQNNAKKAVKYHLQALSIQRDLFKGLHPSIADSLTALGHLFFNRRDFRRAIDTYREALEIRRKLHGEEHRDVAIAFANLGFALAGDGNLSDSAQNLSRAGHLIQQHQYPDIQEVGRSLAAVFRDVSERLLRSGLLDIDMLTKIEYSQQANALVLQFPEPQREMTEEEFHARVRQNMSQFGDGIEGLTYYQASLGSPLLVNEYPEQSSGCCGCSCSLL